MPFGHMVRAAVALRVESQIDISAARRRKGGVEDVSDFRDASGRTIQMRLDLLEETPRSYLTRIAFREALDRRCQDSAKLALPPSDSERCSSAAHNSGRRIGITPPITGKIAVSADGKTRTVTTSRMDPKGNPFTSTAVYDKQ